MSKLIFVLVVSILLTGCGGAEERKEVYLEKAKQSLESGNLDKARIELKNVLQIDPKEAKAYFQLAEIFDRKKEYRKAFNNYLKAAEYAPENLEYHAKIGAYYLMLAGDVDAAIEKRDLVLGKDASNADGLLLKASILFKQKDLDGAKKITQDVYSRKPGHVQNALLLSSFYLSDKSYEKAIDVLRSAIEKNPENRLLLNALAEAYLNARKLDLAENIYNDAIKNEPEVFINYLKLAVFYKMTEQLGKAEEVLRKAIDGDKNDEKRQLALVEFLQQEMGNQAAIDEIRSLITKYPENGSYRITLAQLYRQENDYQNAENILKSTISEFSDDAIGVKARVHLASIYIQNKGIDAAEGMIRDAEKISPNDADVNFIKAKLQLIENDYEGAIISLRSVIKDDPENMKAYILLSSAHSASGNNIQADEIIDLAYENNKANAKGLILLANYLAKNNKNIKLEKVIDHYLAIDSDNYEALSYKSALLNNREMFSEAKPYALKMLELFPNQPNGYIQSVPYLLDENSRDKAISLLEAGFNAVIDNSHILDLLVSLYIGEENYDLAETKVRSAINNNEDVSELHMLLAKIYWASGNKEEAKVSLHDAIIAKPDWNRPYIYLADIYRSNNNIQEAIDILKQGLMKNEGDYELTLSMAKIYEEQDQFDLAINAYEKAYVKYPNNVVIINNLAILLSERSNSEGGLMRAKNLADKLKDNDQSIILDTAGWVYYKVGDYKQSVAILKAVVEKTSEVPIFNYHLGMALYKTGDEAAAKTYLNRSLTNSGDFPGKADAEALLKKLQ